MKNLSPDQMKELSLSQAQGVINSESIVMEEPDRFLTSDQIARVKELSRIAMRNAKSDAVLRQMGERAFTPAAYPVRPILGLVDHASFVTR